MENNYLSIINNLSKTINSYYKKIRNDDYCV